jgi:hypothetical protein
LAEQNIFLAVDQCIGGGLLLGQVAEKFLNGVYWESRPIKKVNRKFWQGELFLALLSDFFQHVSTAFITVDQIVFCGHYL